MKKRLLTRIAILAAPIIWRRIQGRRGRLYPWHRHRGWHERPHHFGRKRGGIWL